MMKAVVYTGSGVRVEQVPRPTLIDPTDIIVKVSLTAICGSDLHLSGGLLPGVEIGDILGHEFMGTVVETGKNVKKVAVGDRIIVPAIISCGSCFYCKKGEFAHCDVSNPNHEISEQVMGFAPAGIFGFSKTSGSYAGGQAEYVRVPFADVGAFKVPAALTDEQAIFLTDVFPTGWMAAENCDIKQGDTVAVWGCGAVGQFAIRSAILQGAGQVIAIDRFSDRLKMAAQGGAHTVNYEDGDVLEQLKRLTEGRGPDCCIDAVGMEAHGTGFTDMIDRAKQFLMLESDRPATIREILRCCRKGGRVSIPGAYSGTVDSFPLGFAFNKGLSLKMGITHMHKYLPLLVKLVENKEIDPSFVITHRIKLDDAAQGYEMFRVKEDGCIKVVMIP